MATTIETASVQFTQWKDIYLKEKPFMLFVPLKSPGDRFSNVDFTSREIEIHDIRGHEKSFNLDMHGFKIAHLQHPERFLDHSKFESDYLPAVKELLQKEVEGVDRVVFFDWRRRNAAAEPSQQSISDRSQFLPPSNTAHVDQAPIAAYNRVLEQLGEDAPRFLNGRVRIINIWRPVENPVVDWPLAVCDGSTVTKKDFIDTDQVRETHVGSSMFMMPNERMKWQFLRDQAPHEVLLFKQFDSLNDVKARFCPHTAFQLRNIPEGSPPRISVEVRALVLTARKDEGLDREQSL